MNSSQSFGTLQFLHVKENKEELSPQIKHTIFILLS